MADLFWLSDEQWAVLEPFMPTNQPGARRVDDRRVISGIVHVLKRGGRWRDCPAAHGPLTTVYNRYSRWSRRGFWRAMLAALAEAGWVTEMAALDSTSVKAHRSAHGGKGGESPGHRPVAGRPDHQGSRCHGRSRAACRRPPHPRQRLGREDSTRGARRPRSPQAPRGGPRLRRQQLARRPEGSAHDARHPWHALPQAPDPPRSAALPRALAHRGRLLPPQRLPARGDPLRQARGQLRFRRGARRRHRVLALIEARP
jgi:transposase